jgi:hypothetical protein
VLLEPFRPSNGRPDKGQTGDSQRLEAFATRTVKRNPFLALFGVQSNNDKSYKGAQLRLTASRGTLASSSMHMIEDGLSGTVILPPSSQTRTTGYANGMLPWLSLLARYLRAVA